jgi:hypothetical protein
MTHNLTPEGYAQTKAKLESLSIAMRFAARTSP